MKKRTKNHCVICHTTRPSRFHDPSCECCIAGLCHWCSTALPDTLVQAEEHAECAQCHRETVLYRDVYFRESARLCGLCTVQLTRRLPATLPALPAAVVH